MLACGLAGVDSDVHELAVERGQAAVQFVALADPHVQRLGEREDRPGRLAGTDAIVVQVFGAARCDARRQWAEARECFA